MARDISATVAGCQQRHYWTVPRRAISVAVVKNKRPPATTRQAKPTAEDLAAAARLRAIWEREKAARAGTANPLTQEVAGEALGVNQSSVSQYLGGKIPLNYRALIIFAKVLGVDPTDIRSDLPEQTENPSPPAGADETEWDNISGYSQPASLGTGHEPNEYAEAHKLKFRASSLRRKGLRPQHLHVYYGAGDSMEPRITEGDAILFDTSDTTPKDGAIFMIQRGREIFAKRCEILDGIVYFRSDNPRGTHTWNKARRMDNPRDPITILGRVRWIGSWED